MVTLGDVKAEWKVCELDSNAPASCLNRKGPFMGATGGTCVGLLSASDARLRKAVHMGKLTVCSLNDSWVTGVGGSHR